jgi:hypothetical protein
MLQVHRDQLLEILRGILHEIMPMMMLEIRVEVASLRLMGNET